LFVTGPAQALQGFATVWINRMRLHPSPSGCTAHARFMAILRGTCRKRAS